MKTSMNSVTIHVPATTANLGPGFDTLGLALDLWNETEFAETGDGKLSLTVLGEGEKTLPCDETNAIAAAALQVYALVGKEPDGLAIRCTNRIPLISGLGSSSAALLTGMLGGLVATVLSGDKIVSRKLVVSPMTITVVLPDFYFPTKAAREILPEYVLRQDAIFNVSRAVLVIKSLETGDLTLLGEVMEDALHQPYRLPLIPGALAAMHAARQAGASAVALSGAGPSLIAFSRQPANPAIGLAMKKAFEQAGLSARIFPLNISQSGASCVETATVR